LELNGPTVVPVFVPKIDMEAPTRAGSPEGET
jgi:hypothetical protein